MDGLLLIDKPLGWTSFAVVSHLRWILSVKKMGHGGTLDPLATGLLIVLVGKATRQFSQFSQSDKTYEACIRFGFSTETDDREGRPLEDCTFSSLAEEKIQKILPSFLGEQWQRPPTFCAKKWKGVPYHCRARRGIFLEPPPQKIRIHRLEFLDWNAPLLRLRICGSGGIYVRSFARDLGQSLRCPAHLHALRRIRSGNFSLEQAISLPLSGKADFQPLSMWKDV
jgi:tRNA pseudouridine55 synthase